MMRTIDIMSGVPSFDYDYPLSFRLPRVISESLAKYRERADAKWPTVWKHALDLYTFVVDAHAEKRTDIFAVRDGQRTRWMAPLIAELPARYDEDPSAHGATIQATPESNKYGKWNADLEDRLNHIINKIAEMRPNSRQLKRSVFQKSALLLLYQYSRFLDENYGIEGKQGKFSLEASDSQMPGDTPVEQVFASNSDGDMAAIEQEFQDSGIARFSGSVP